MEIQINERIILKVKSSFIGLTEMFENSCKEIRITPEEMDAIVEAYLKYKKDKQEEDIKYILQKGKEILDSKTSENG